MSKKKLSLQMIIFLQVAVIIYTFAGVFGKLAGRHEFLSLWFIIWFGCEFLVLGIYAILWQQIIKRVDLSVAYVNRSLALIWSMLWAYLFFSDDGTITAANLVGVAIIILGTMIVNSDNG